MKNEGAPQEYTWTEMKLISEIEALKRFIESDPKQSLRQISEEEAKTARLKLTELENKLRTLREARK